jgi:hypothetical protein|tara:strand:+ start:291 stop:497 length:207 start_codon:yes stop_codon:yes gene_type:complete
MHVRDLHVGQTVPWRAAEFDLKSGIPVVYHCRERDAFVQEFPDGRIQEVTLDDNGNVFPVDPACPSFG